MMPTRPSGFTIIELMVYISIVTVAITVFSAFMLDVTKNASRSKTIKEVQQNAQFIMNRITNDIRHAQAVTIPALGASGADLTLTMSPTLTATYHFDNAASTVTYQQNSGTAMAISNNQVRVTNLSFSNTGSAITVTLAMAQGLATAPVAGQYNTTLTSTAVVHSSLY